MHGQKVQLLGPVLVVWEVGNPPRFRTQRTMALLGYLAAERRAVTRNALVALFWPDEEVSKGKANLRRELHNLGSILPGCWEIDRQSVRFIPHAETEVDIYALRRLERDEQWPEAARYVVGDFLEGIYLDDNSEFETWLLGEREYWHQRTERVLSQAVSEQLSAGDAAGALYFARRLLHLLPWHEAMHRQVMVLLAQLGERDAALRQYAQCKAVLQAELGVEVSAETKMLYERIRETYTFALHNIPASTTSLIGRDDELALLNGWLKAGDVRLITITGAGGMGKTRLALGLAQQLLGRPAHPFTDGIYFISLASLQAPEQIISSIADVLKFPFQNRDGRSPRQQLLDYLRGKRILLILDNFEHLLDGAELVAEIMKAAPGIHILATSRERLRLHGEQVLRLQGLGYDEAGEQGSNPSPSAAVRLFLSAAERIRPGFGRAGGNDVQLCRICRLVEGMPLALELAATWTDTLSLAAIGDGIEARIDFLEANRRDVPQRHQSILAVFDTSWQRLSSQEQHIFAGLSVFRGGLDRSAAEAVAHATAQILTRLVISSLLQYEPERDRYKIHELLRQYVANYLTSAEATAVHKRHLTYFAKHVERLQPEQENPAWAADLNKLEVELGNIRTALDWSFQEPDAASEGLRLATAMESFFRARGRVNEGLDYLSHLLAIPSTGVELQIRAQALTAAGYMVYICTNDRARAIDLCKESVKLLEALEHKNGLFIALRRLGHIERMSHNIEQATAYYQKALRLAQELSNERSLCLSLIDLGVVILQQQDPDLEAANSLFWRGLTLARQVRDKGLIADFLMSLGLISMERKEWLPARSYLQEALTLHQESGHKWGMGNALGYLGELARCEQKYDMAAHYHYEGFILFRDRGVLSGVGNQAAKLGQTYLMMGQMEQAVSYLQECLLLGQKNDHQRHVALSLEGFANLASAQQEPERAARLWGAAQRTRESMRIPLTIADRLAHEHFVKLAREEIEQRVFNASWAEGRDMTLEQAINYALEKEPRTRRFSLTDALFVN